MRNPEETLDPQDWENPRLLAHNMIDDAIRHLDAVRDRNVWQEMPDDVRAHHKTSAPMEPQPLEAVCGELRENRLPYSMGNIHPRVWGWCMGSGNFTGALDDFLADIDGSNLGGGEELESAL